MHARIPNDTHPNPAKPEPNTISGEPRKPGKAAVVEQAQDDRKKATARSQRLRRPASMSRQAKSQ
jgi:hypothetical protein